TSCIHFLVLFSSTAPSPTSILFPYTTLFRSPLLSVRNLYKRFPVRGSLFSRQRSQVHAVEDVSFAIQKGHDRMYLRPLARKEGRSEEHTSELQSRENLVCRLLLEKKKNKKIK